MTRTGGAVWGGAPPTTTAAMEGRGSGIAGVAPDGVGLAGVPEKGAPAGAGADAEAPPAARSKCSAVCSSSLFEKSTDLMK